MVLFAILTAISCVTTIVDAINCVTEEPSERTLATISTLKQNEAFLLAKRRTSNISVPVYMNLVVAEGKENVYSNEQIQSQYNVMAEIFAQYNIHFSLQSISLTVDSILARGPFNQGLEFQDFMKATREGDYATLNIYYYSDMDTTISGFCNMPSIGGNEEP
jgi:hypothetical protein